MVDDIRRPPRSLLSNSPVQPVHVDGLLNALADMISAQASLADALSRICLGMARSDDRGLSSAAVEASQRLQEVGRRLSSAIEQLRTVRDNVK